MVGPAKNQLMGDPGRLLNLFAAGRGGSFFEQRPRRDDAGGLELLGIDFADALDIDDGTHFTAPR